MVVVVDPVLQPAAGVRERGEHRLLEKLPPDRLPEPLDLAQRHRMLRGPAHVLHALLAQHLLEARLPAPGHELTTVVGEDLAWRTPLPDRALQHLEHRVGILLPEQTPARQVARVIVQDADEVDRVHPLELEREDVDLPHRVRARALETPDPRRAASRLRRWMAQARLVDHRAHLLRADVDRFVAPEIVPDPSHAVLGILSTQGDDLLLQQRALIAYRDRRGFPTQPLHPGFGVVLPPLVDRAGAHADQLADLGCRKTGVQRLEGQDLDLHGQRRRALDPPLRLLDLPRVAGGMCGWGALLPSLPE